MPYGAVYQNYQAVQEAIRQLAEVVSEDQIQVIRRGGQPLSIFPEDYDPLGAYWFTGTAVHTLPASGENLIGNSVTMNVSLDILPELLAETADAVNQSQPEERDKPSYLLIVNADDPQIERIMQQAGGEIVNLTEFDNIDG